MLSPLLAVLFAFPTAAFTVLLGVVLVYWLFVIIGAAHLDLLGDGAADGMMDGMDVGHADIGHVHVEGGDLDAGHADGGDADGDGDGGDGDGDEQGGAHGLLASLKLRAVPATVVLSVIILSSWLFSIAGVHAAGAWLPPGGIQTAAHFLLLVLAPMLALPVTSIVVRPLVKVFAPHAAVTRTDLVGKVCTVRTGTVTDRFGEGLLDDGGAGVVVRIRVDSGETVKRGDQVVIVDYDEAKQEFTVAPMESLAGDERDEDTRDAGASARLLK